MPPHMAQFLRIRGHGHGVFNFTPNAGYIKQIREVKANTVANRIAFTLCQNLLRAN